jgi:hypothetical protein
MEDNDFIDVLAIDGDAYVESTQLADCLGLPHLVVIEKIESTLKECPHIRGDDGWYIRRTAILKTSDGPMISPVFAISKAGFCVMPIERGVEVSAERIAQVLEAYNVVQMELCAKKRAQ